MQVDMLAITDHDTTDGLQEAREAIANHKLSLALVPGIEVSTRWHNFGIHIVGLNVDENDQNFQVFVRKQKSIRGIRARKIAEKLEKTGFESIYHHAESVAKGGEITRAHFARALVQYHGVASMADAFKRFMGKGNAGDVKADWPSIETAVAAIHQANGVAVLAHPLKYDLSTKWLRRLVSHFADVKGDGVEVAGPGVAGEKQSLIHDIVSDANLMGSVGSDFHNPGRWTELGRFQQVLPSVEPIWRQWTNTNEA
jgi:predicted metal-dependent phosphoesterase TrpH